MNSPLIVSFSSVNKSGKSYDAVCVVGESSFGNPKLEFVPAALLAFVPEPVDLGHCATWKDATKAAAALLPSVPNGSRSATYKGGQREVSDLRSDAGNAKSELRKLAKVKLNIDVTEGNANTMLSHIRAVCEDLPRSIAKSIEFLSALPNYSEPTRATKVAAKVADTQDERIDRLEGTMAAILAKLDGIGRANR